MADKKLVQNLRGELEEGKNKKYDPDKIFKKSNILNSTLNPLIAYGCRILTLELSNAPITTIHAKTPIHVINGAAK